MSDNWIVLIPQDPWEMSDSVRMQQALERLKLFAPEADEARMVCSDKPQFFDCGANFERVLCPSCHRDIPMAWFQDQMELDYDGQGFRIAKYVVPCCAAQHTLNELRYEWPQGFARIGLELMNPNIGELTDEQRFEIESVLSVPLRVVYQHL